METLKAQVHYGPHLQPQEGLAVFTWPGTAYSIPHWPHIPLRLCHWLV